MTVNIVNVGYDSTNYYVVGGDGTRILVDVGWPGTLPKLLACLKRKDIALEDLDFLFVTHYHPDHAGLVQELKERGLKHIVLEEQVAAIPKLREYMKADSGFVDILVEDSIHLVDAESRTWLKGIGLQGEVVGTPGHSEDSVSLVLDNGIAFTGDLVLAGLVDEGNGGTVGQSWDLLRKLKVRTIYPGHGPFRPLP
jgi:endoribonuclease LACTB2